LNEDSEQSTWLSRRRETLESRLKLVRMLRAASPPLVATAALAALVAGLLPVGLILAGGVLSGRIEDALAGGEASGDWNDVYWAFGAVMALFLASEVMVPVQNRLRWFVTKRVDGEARLRVMRAALAGTDMTRLHGPEFLEAMRLGRGLIH
jgi:hypothetical protein